jgi:hypothetical protein
VLVPAGTNKSTLRHHGIQAVTMRVIAYIADAVTLTQLAYNFTISITHSTSSSIFQIFSDETLPSSRQSY